jgi:hypothetical protein
MGYNAAAGLTGVSNSERRTPTQITGVTDPFLRSRRHGTLEHFVVCSKLNSG